MTGDTEDLNGEIAAIEQRMVSDRRGYFRDEAAQARYRDLLGMREAVAPPAEGRPDEAPVPVATPSEFRAEAEKAGLDPARAASLYGTYQKATMAAADVVLAVPAAERAAFKGGFDALPEAVQAAAFATLTAPPPSVMPASRSDLDRFAATPEGRELVREWGGDAPRRLGVLRERMYRWLERLPEGDVRRANGWFDALPAGAAKAVMKRLAA